MCKDYFDPYNNSQQTPWNIVGQKLGKLDDMDSGMLEKHWLLLKEGHNIKTSVHLKSGLKIDLSNLNYMTAVDVLNNNQIVKIRRGEAYQRKRPQDAEKYNNEHILPPPSSAKLEGYN